MVKHRKRRKYGRPLNFSEAVALANLADQTEQHTNFDDAVSRESWFISMDIMATMNGHTAGEGPIHMLVGDSDYTSAEVLEWWLATNAWDTGDRIAQEQARRKIRRVCTFSGGGLTEVANDGKPIRVKLGWMVEEDRSLFLGGVNDSGAILTTGTVLRGTGQIYHSPR